MLNHSTDQRLFILAEHRSGSSWLMETLHSHPELQLFGETLNHVENRKIAKYLGGNTDNFHDCLTGMENTFKKQSWKKYLKPWPYKKIRFCGCKILLNQLTLIGDAFPSCFFDFYRNASFVFLYRTNIVAQQVSLQMAHHYNIWHVKNKRKVTLKQVHLCPSIFVANLENTLLLREKILKLLDANEMRYYPLAYEDLFAQRENNLGEIFAFLGLKERKVMFSKEIKSNPFQPRRVISNYEEVMGYLQPYPAFLNMLENS